MMLNTLMTEIFSLITLFAVILVILFVITFWSRHYSRNAKALTKRLGDIVNMRSSVSDLSLIHI
jgi:hypothetical protein